MGKAKQRLVLRVTVLVLVKLLIPAAMVENLAEKIDGCPLNRGCVQLGPQKLSIIQSRGCPLLRGLLKY